jgi:hypothetical protein
VNNQMEGFRGWLASTRRCHRWWQAIRHYECADPTSAPGDVLAAALSAEANVSYLAAMA